MSCTKPLNLGDRVVSCGHCIQCLIKKSQEWAFRLEQESKTAKSGVFLTLTYDDKNAIWIDDSEGNPITTLHKPDFQKFMKRLRKAQGPLKNPKDYREKLRYFMCGEYGPETGRAHYHAIIFNLNQDVIQKLDSLWGKGIIKVGDVSPKSIRYVTNYMLLKDKTKEENQQNPFTLMSKKPILGANYVVKNSYHHNEHLDFKLVHAQKNRRNLYRCYERKIFNDNEQKLIKEKRQSAFAELRATFEKSLEQIDPLDPLGKEREDNEHKSYILSKRQTKRKL